MRSLCLWAFVFSGLPALVSARDVYGNATPWTTSDTIIWDLHQKQNAFVPPSSGQPSWQSQIAARDAQKRLAAETAARDAVESRERNARIAQRAAEFRPLTWAQEMARYIVWNGDRAAPEQEELAFYFVNQGDLVSARRHLEMTVFRKRPRAGEAAWQLYQLHKPDGPEPDAAQAARDLSQSIALGYSAGVWQLAISRYRGDPARNIAPDPAGALPLFETILAGNDRRYSADAGRLLLAYDLQTPGREPHAITVMRRLHATGSADRISDGTLWAALLIKSPGGWKEHSAEVITALRSAPADGESHGLLARVYLGLEPAAAAYVAPNAESASSALRALARLDQPAADELLAHVLPRGSDQRLSAAEVLLAELVELHPESLVYGQRYAEVMSGQFGGEPNLPAALKLYQRLSAKPDAAPTNISAAARLVATDLPGKPADPVAAFPLWERAAKQWERYAQYRYAEALLRGIGCKADPAAALEYLEKTTLDARPDAAAYPLYTLCAQAMRESAPTNADLLRRASGRAATPRLFPPAELEQARCIYARSKVDSAGSFDPAEPGIAFTLVERAARSGLDEARLLLARFYREGFGTPVDLEAAQEIFTGGVTANVPMAMAALAEIQLEPGNRFHDASSGFALANRAATAGDPRGQFLLGRCYLRGEGTAVDLARATEALTRSAAAGDVDALTCLADQRLGGVKPDAKAYAQSIQDLQQAAAGGSLDAAVRLFKALANDPSRTPERLKKLNQLLAARTWIQPEDEALVKDAEMVMNAASQLALLTGQRRDPALSYETALWMLGEKTSFGPPTGLTYFNTDLISEAAREGHAGAQYREALWKIAIGQDYLATPEEDAVAYKDYDSKYSAGHLSEGLDALRAAAAGGEARARAYLTSRGIDLVSAVPDGTIDQAAIEKIDPRVRGGRREGEYLIAVRAMRIAREYLAKPEEDASVLAAVGQKYSDAYYDEALKYFRSSAAAGLPEAMAFLKTHGIALETSVESAPADRATLSKIKAN